MTAWIPAKLERPRLWSRDPCRQPLRLRRFWTICKKTAIRGRRHSETPPSHSASGNPAQGLTTMSPDQVADVEVNVQMLARDMRRESICVCVLASFTEGTLASGIHCSRQQHGTEGHNRGPTALEFAYWAYLLLELLELQCSSGRGRERHCCW